MTERGSLPYITPPPSTSRISDSEQIPRASREASTALEDDDAEMIITLFLLGRAQPDPLRLNVSPCQVRKGDWRVSEKVGQGRNRTRKS